MKKKYITPDLELTLFETNEDIMVLPGQSEVDPFNRRGFTTLEDWAKYENEQG